MQNYLILCFFFFSMIFPQKTGDKKTVTLTDGIHIEMVFIEPGSFIMGSPDSELERNAARERQHHVKLTKGFWIAKTETTQLVWKSVLGKNPSKIVNPSHPVENVSYIDVTEFICKLNSEGFEFRLPTEAEWEYACRAGTSTPYAGIRDEMTWHRNNANGTTHPVAQKKPNPWGLYDMHGNVGEITEDYLQEYLSDSTDPKGPQIGEYKVLRGGQYSGRVRHTRSSDRQRLTKDERLFYVGFRLAMDN